MKDEGAVYKALIPSRWPSEKELTFRESANLCMGCGMAHREPGTVLCFACAQEQEQKAA